MTDTRERSDRNTKGMPGVRPWRTWYVRYTYKSEAGEIHVGSQEVKARSVHEAQRKVKIQLELQGDRLQHVYGAEEVPTT